jgi:hypothetical protein
MFPTKAKTDFCLSLSHFLLITLAVLGWLPSLISDITDSKTDAQKTLPNLFLASCIWYVIDSLIGVGQYCFETNRDHTGSHCLEIARHTVNAGAGFCFAIYPIINPTTPYFDTILSALSLIYIIAPIKGITNKLLKHCVSTETHKHIKNKFTGITPLYAAAFPTASLGWLLYALLNKKLPVHIAGSAFFLCSGTVTAVSIMRKPRQDRPQTACCLSRVKNKDIPQDTDSLVESKEPLVK